MEDIKLTAYSHGAGCGCKISPKILDQILHGNIAMPDHKNLLVGNHTKDDAAVLDLGNGTALISTTDFFMPIVDDPFMFGRIAACNAISDVYAMGGKPVMAIAILGWPVNILSPEIAQKVLDGARTICIEAGIPLAGGHSIDSPEPIFGLAVNGIVDKVNIKQNNKAKSGDVLYLTKPLGVGILTTAEKKGLLKPEHQMLAANQMMKLNKIGEALGTIKGINAMTDVTGFGLLGHLSEMAEGSDLTAEIDFMRIPLITSEIKNYIDLGCIPGGTLRNKDSYGHQIGEIDEFQWAILADPQTSGGLLISVEAEAATALESVLKSNGLGEFCTPIGRFNAKGALMVTVN
jgi:selenide, water dikinase